MKFKLYMLLMTIGCYVQGQDTHYWNNDYCTGGFFNPGAVIANNRDSGVVYINPALLAFNKKNAVAVSGDLYRLSHTNIKDALGKGLDLNNLQGKIAPLLATNILYLPIKVPFSLAYGLGSNAISNTELSQRKDGVQNILQDSYSPGEEIIVGNFGKTINISETNAFISFGRKYKEKWAFGFTIEGIYRNHKYIENSNARVIINDTIGDSFFPSNSSIYQLYSAKYWHASAKAKFGLAYEATNNLHFGLVLSSPNIGLVGKGTIVVDESISNIKSDLDAEAFNFVGTSKQTGVNAKYHQPFAVAFGVIKDFKKANVYLSTEYFHSVKEYNILTPKDEIYARPQHLSILNSPNDIRLFDAKRRLINFSFGISYKFQPSLTGFASFRSDFTYVDPQYYTVDNLSEGYYSGTLSTWNQYHVQLGGNFIKRKFNLKAGINFNYGQSNSFLNKINYDTSSEANFLLGFQSLSKANYWLIGFLITYVHNI